MKLSGKKLLFALFGLVTLTASLALVSNGRAQDTGAQPVVVKKKLTLAAAGEAQTAASNPASVVRKKLPAQPSPAPAVVETVEPPAPEATAAGSGTTPGKEPGAAVPAAAGGAPPAAAGAPAASTQPPAAAAAPAAAPAVKGSAATPAGPAPAPQPRAMTSRPPAAGKETRSPKPGSEPLARKTPAERASMPYSILLASHRQKENALEELPRYRQSGLTPYVVLTEVGSKGAWWRTLCGQYKSLAEALQTQKTLKLSDAVVVRTPYANLVGEYADGKDAAQMSVRLSQMGLFPYTLKGPGNMVMLLVGAFATQEAAEQNRGELQGKGINAQTIER
jgi:cell division septation protein DedD